MALSSGRMRRRQALRETILEAARQIVLDEGYGALTMRRIAEAIDYSPAAIYQHFPGRDDLAAELSRTGFAELVSALEGVAAVDDPVARLLDLGARYLRFGIERPETYRMIFMEDPKVTSSVFEAQAADPNDPGMRAYLLLVTPFDMLRAAGRLREDLASTTAADALWCFLHGVVSLRLTCPSFPGTPVETLVPAGLEALLAGFQRA
jgi:AcrR family transcriptional regulator